MFSREGFDLTDFRAELAEKGKPSTLETLRDEIDVYKRQLLK